MATGDPGHGSRFVSRPWWDVRPKFGWPLLGGGMHCPVLLIMLCILTALPDVSKMSIPIAWCKRYMPHNIVCSWTFSWMCFFVNNCNTMSVALLGWVSPRVATEYVSSIFFLQKTTFLEFFSHHCLPVLRCHPYLFLGKKLTTLFARHFYSVHSCISRTFFYLSDLLCPLFFVSLWVVKSLTFGTSDYGIWLILTTNPKPHYPQWARDG